MEEFKPRIGKNVIETLTLGMYENAFFIYREYVQNAADQIDVAVEEGILDKKSDGLINISVNKAERSITVEDNATGIKRDESLKFLGDVAESQKDRTKRKGFRGIGRLGGLGYCEKLIFETSYKGEFVKTIITLDAKKLKELLEDKAITLEASSVISIITSLDGEGAEKDEHYFKVKLVNVTNEELLDDTKVRNYLSMVAPIPFRKDFLFKEKINNYFLEKGMPIEEYDVKLDINNERLYKAYKLKILGRDDEPSSMVSDVSFFDIRSAERELIALGWYGVTDKLNKVIHQNNIERGLRIRKSNIQIGDEDTLNRFFKEDRYNHHFVGEIHVFGEAFIPNARRDYFNDGKTVNSFESGLREQFKSLTKLARFSSNLHSRLREINTYQEKKDEFDSRSFRSREEENHYQTELRQYEDKAIRALHTIEEIDYKSKPETPEFTLLKNIVGDKDLSLKSLKNTASNGSQSYVPPSFSKLNDSQKLVIMEIFSILDKNLDPQKAEKIKQIIIENYD